MMLRFVASPAETCGARREGFRGPERERASARPLAVRRRAGPARGIGSAVGVAAPEVVLVLVVGGDGDGEVVVSSGGSLVYCMDNWNTTDTIGLARSRR